MAYAHAVGADTVLVLNADLGPLQRKGDRTPAEARMPLRATPHVPSWAALVTR